MQCTAHARSGERCRRDATPGKSVCNLHGGLSLGGIAAPGFKTGRYSKYLPTRMLGKYQESLNDPDLLELRDEVSLLDARLSDVLGRIDSGESGQTWADLKRAYDDLTNDAIDPQKKVNAVQRMSTLISRGQSDYAAWQEVHTLLDNRRKLVESERKRLVEMQQVITSERVIILATAILDIIRRNVEDRKVLNAISNDINRLLSFDHPERVERRTDDDESDVLSLPDSVQE